MNTAIIPRYTDLLAHGITITPAMEPKQMINVAKEPQPYPEINSVAENNSLCYLGPRSVHFANTVDPDESASYEVI